MTPKRLPQQPLPQFHVGETIELKGVKFTIQRINRSNIVLRPVKTGTQRARDIIRRLTSQREG